MNSSLLLVRSYSPNSTEVHSPTIMLILQEKFTLSISFHFQEFATGCSYGKNLNNSIGLFCIGGEEICLLTLPLEVRSWL